MKKNKKVNNAVTQYINNCDTAVKNLLLDSEARESLEALISVVEMQLKRKHEELLKSRSESNKI